MVDGSKPGSVRGECSTDDGRGARSHLLCVATVADNFTNLNKCSLQLSYALASLGDPPQFKVLAGETGKCLEHRPFHLAQSCRPRSGIDDTQPTDYRPGSKNKRRASVCPEVPFARDKRIALRSRIGRQIDDL